MAEDISKKILLSIQLDNSELIKRTATTRVELNKLKEEKKRLDKQLASGELKEGSAEFDQLTQAIEKNNAQQRLLNKEIQANNRVLDNQVKATNAADGSYEQLAAQYNLTKEALNKMSAEERLSTETGQQLEQESANLYEQMKALQEATGKYVLSVGDYNSEGAKAASATTIYANNLDGLNKKLADLKKELAGTEIGSKRFEELNTTIKDTQLQIQQVQGNVDEFGQKEKKNLVAKSYDDMADAAAGATSAIGLLTVAFGDNENIQEVQAKLVTTIAVAQGIQNIAKARGAVIDLAAVARTKALTIAQSTYAQVVGKSTGAMKGFKVALATTGLGAILILLGELILNFDGVSKQVNKAVNYIRDFADQVSGGNKVVRGLVEILLLTISPLVTVIRLVSDFNGTITTFQNSINGAMDSIKEMVDGIPLLGSVINANQKAFNFLTNAVKSLGGEQKKFKVDLETLTKVYERHNATIDRNKKQIDDQLRLAKAQGKSEKELADLTRQSLTETMKAREIAFNQALSIQKQLVQQNGKLTDEQEKLFLQASDDFKSSQVDLKVFEAEQLRERNEKYKEFTANRLQLERDLQAELNALIISQIKDEIDREEAALNEQRRIDKENNDLRLKDAVKNYGERSKEADQIRQIELEQQSIYNDALFQLEVSRLNKEADALNEQIILKQDLAKKEFEVNADNLTKQFELDKQYLDATITDQQKNQKAKLDLSLKYYQDQLALAKDFAQQDGILTEEELTKLGAIQGVIDDISGQITELSSGNVSIAEMIGLDEKSISKIEFGANQVLTVLSTISDVVNADAANRIRAIDDQYKYEENLINQSTLSQAQKEQKLQALTEKTAKEKYAVELEQFRINKGLQIAQAGISGALAVIQSLANTTVPFPFSLINPIAIGAVTAAQIGIIASQPEPPPPSFDTGGFTGSGFMQDHTGHKVAGVVHDNEWVAPKWMVKHPSYAPHIKALENIRTRGFAFGGFTTPSNNTGGMTIDYEALASVITSQIAKMPNPVVTVSDINVANEGVQRVGVNASL